MTGYNYKALKTLEKAITRYGIAVIHERKTEKEETRINCYLLAEACEEVIPQMLNNIELYHYTKERLTKKYETIYNKRRENY